MFFKIYKCLIFRKSEMFCAHNSYALKIRLSVLLAMHFKSSITSLSLVLEFRRTYIRSLFVAMILYKKCNFVGE